MQILMSEAAQARVADRLAALGGDLDIVTIAADGTIKRAGTAIDDADPEVFWLSLDLFPSGLIPAFVGHVLRGTRGRWLQSLAAGVDNPAFKTVIAKGIRLTKSSAQAPPIAEYVMAHALSLLHPIARQRLAQQARDWRQVPFHEIGASRWLMLGFGAIGTEIARRLQPFGADLTVVRRHIAPEPLAARVAPTADLISLLPDADVVVLACALTDETRGIAGPAFFGAMKKGSLLINIARGGLVDEAALRAGLERDQPAQAVLDVFETEPLPKDAWFWDHPKVRVTAHGSNAGDGLAGRSDALFLENLRRYRAGEPLLGEAHKSEVGL
ncbi:MAG TPA: NAD(P)-dependent oxidoreductase [Rhizomicrobium sp.]|jgi:phosphoglycerate dehydrogenase-like enzyme|nr:NAD(P)-dependent oxidoreductase [Rhizomicrobium sp.]